jgi:triacylglycerol lipase
MSAASAVTLAQYDPAVATSMANLSEWTYWQYEQGIANPSFDGAIPAQPGYTQVASFTAPEIDFGAVEARLKARFPQLATGGSSSLAADASLQQALSQVLTDRVAVNQLVTGDPTGVAAGLRTVFYGFALADAGAGNHVIALRGTRSTFEWLEDALAFQVPIPLAWFNDEDKVRLAQAHFGFLLVFAFLAEQIQAASKQLASTSPVVVTGHSLGAGVATLAALASALFGYGDGQTSMYNFASPRVGDPVFAGAFNAFVPNGFRVVNLTDVVPILPPTPIAITLFGHAFTFVYQHVGQQWSYLWQTGEVGDNHALKTNYLPAVTAAVPVSKQPDYPVSGICP